MVRLFRWLIAGHLGLALAVAQPTLAQTLPDLLKGRWIMAGGDCQAGITLQLAGEVLRWTDAAGHVDTQRVISRRATGFATRPSTATDGKAWVYEILAPGFISLIEGSVDRSAALTRCPDTLPATATPRQVIQAIYAHYAASDEANLPFSGEANVRAVFVADLADQIAAFVSHSGRVADDCRPADPFVPGAFGEYRVTQIHVYAAPVATGADHATARVSLRNFGKPATVSVALARTPAGWRVADVSPGPGQSFRASMAACAKPPE